MKTRLVRGDRSETVVDIDAEDEDFRVIKHDGVYYLYHGHTSDTLEEVYAEVTVRDTSTMKAIIKFGDGTYYCRDAHDNRCVTLSIDHATRLDRAHAEKIVTTSARGVVMLMVE